MDLIGKGTKMVTDKNGKTYNANKGAVWVARLIPDGYVSAHANHARITTFPIKGKEVITSKNIDKIYNKEVTTVYAYDAISFAKEAKLYVGADENFSFSDVYAPADFHATRFCALRVWAMFNKVTDGMDKYWDYAIGHNLHCPVPAVAGQPLKPENFPDNRMPLWVLPGKKIDVEAMFYFMRDHLEGTPLDMANDIGAGPFACPYRWRPMTWSIDGGDYIHERVTATQQTGFSFVTQSRSWIPNDLGGVFWFGVDDAASSVYAPMYTCMTKIPECYAVGNGDMMTWSETAGFWTFNQLTNLAYTRYNAIHPEIAEKQAGYESKFVKEVKRMDEEIQKSYAQDREKAVNALTSFSVNTANTLVKEWKDFYHYLFVKYLDGNKKTARPVPAGYKYYAPKVEHIRYSNDFYRVIIEKTGDKLKMVE
jgi:dipeptidase